MANDSNVAEIRKACEQIAGVQPEDTQKLFSGLHDIATLYYRDALKQSSQSFLAANIAAVVGTILLAGAIMACLGKPNAPLQSWVSVVPGLIVQAVSGLQFYLYGKASKQFELFHVCLERSGRYLMANSVCANIKDDTERDGARSELVKVMANAQMLPIEAISERMKGPSVRRPKVTPVANLRPIAPREGIS